MRDAIVAYLVQIDEVESPAPRSMTIALWWRATALRGADQDSPPRFRTRNGARARPGLVSRPRVTPCSRRSRGGAAEQWIGCDAGRLRSREQVVDRTPSAQIEHRCDSPCTRAIH